MEMKFLYLKLISLVLEKDQKGDYVHHKEKT